MNEKINEAIILLNARIAVHFLKYKQSVKAGFDVESFNISVPVIEVKALIDEYQKLHDKIMKIEKLMGDDDVDGCKTRHRPQPFNIDENKLPPMPPLPKNSIVHEGKKTKKRPPPLQPDYVREDQPPRPPKCRTDGIPLCEDCHNTYDRCDCTDRCYVKKFWSWSGWKRVERSLI